MLTIEDLEDWLLDQSKTISLAKSNQNLQGSIHILDCVAEIEELIKLKYNYHLLFTEDDQNILHEISEDIISKWFIKHNSLIPDITIFDFTWHVNNQFVARLNLLGFFMLDLSAYRKGLEFLLCYAKLNTGLENKISNFQV